jgi:hypothetical protein
MSTRSMSAMTRPKLALAVLVGLAAALSACGAHHSHNVFAVKLGMTKQQVRSTAGAPYRAGRRCWQYHAKKSGTSIDGMRLCFTNGRVSVKQISVHG